MNKTAFKRIRAKELEKELERRISERSKYVDIMSDLVDSYSDAEDMQSINEGRRAAVLYEKGYIEACEQILDILKTWRY